MTTAIRALAIDDYAFAGGGVGIRVVVADLDDDTGHIRRSQMVLDFSSDGPAHFRPITDEERMGAMPPESTILRLPEGVGEAILSALSRHFHGTASDLDLRADLRHERDRRSRLEESFMTLAHSLSATISIAAGQRWPHFSPSVAYASGGGEGGSGSRFSSGGPTG